MKNPYYVLGAYKNINSIKKYFADGERRDYKTCEYKPIQDFFNTKIDIIYKKEPDGVEVNHQITQLFLDLDISETQKNNFYDLRKNTKNIRKPNEIIIFTDGFSYIAASSFIKDVQLRKGAIIVGYGGNPKNEMFDSSQSPSTVITTEGRRDSYEKFFDNMGFTIRYTLIEYFKYRNNIYYPMEFETTPINERVNLYNKYDDSRYEEFIDEAKKIFDKYDNGNCNPNNKNILLQSDECKFDNDPHALGGYECGDDGKWSKNCVPYYCEMGFYFDIEQKKCITDPCYSIYENEVKKREEEKFERQKNIIFISSIVFAGLFGCFLISFMLTCYCNKVKQKNIRPGTFPTLISFTIIFFVFFIVLLFIWLFEYQLKK